MQALISPPPTFLSPEVQATVDEVCETLAFAGPFDAEGAAALRRLGMGEKMWVAVRAVPRNRPCYQQILDACEGIVRREAAFIDRLGRLWSREQIEAAGGWVDGDRLIFPGNGGE